MTLTHIIENDQGNWKYFFFNKIIFFFFEFLTDFLKKIRHFVDFHEYFAEISMFSPINSIFWLS